MTQKENEYALAERLAKAMGFELSESADATVRLMTSGGNAIGCWYGKEDVLRGCKVFSGRIAPCGLLDIETLWIIPGARLPAGIAKDSSDEELDLTLTVMGF